MSDSEVDAEGELHEYSPGDVLVKIDSSEWEVTNRMVDVDTEEVLYRLRELDTPFNDTDILTKNQVSRAFESEVKNS